ncbi:hypothetical protein D3C80_1736820 [compost metagenome]
MLIFECGFTLWERRLFGDPGFMLRQDLVDLLVFQGQRLALIRLLQTFQQCLKLQVGNLLSQAFAETRPQTVGKIVSVICRGFFVGLSHRKKHAQR